MFARSSLRGVTAVFAASVFLALASSVPRADARPPLDQPRVATAAERLVGGAVDARKAVVDTVLVMGSALSGAPYRGGFQDQVGTPAWNGWTSIDYTDRPNHWHVDTYRVLAGSYSAWCGEAIPSCGAGDPAGGYGNDYRDTLEWRGVVADPGQPCTVTVSALANYDTEPGYDFVHLLVEKAGGEVELWYDDGKADAVTISESHTYLPGEYAGAGGDEVAVAFRFTSDFTWSDADCNWPTAGAMQLDDVVIGLDNGSGVSWGFEDGTLGPFTAPKNPAVGDFAKIWTGLEDIDPCRTDYSPQAAFIDDGVVVPGTGGAPCVNWCYGPGGWIVNTTGGLAGPDYHLKNSVLSPTMAWPSGYDAARLDFSVYQHEDLSADAPGMFWIWGIRSAATEADLADAAWRDRSYFYFGDAGYLRYSFDVSDLVEADAAYVQVQFGAAEMGWVWGWNGDDGYPAPYFDDVRLAASHHYGPALAAEERYLAQDGFPAAGVIDPQDRGAASVRFDMAADVSGPLVATIDPGDSLVIEAGAVRAGAVLAEAPRLHFRLSPNPTYDPYRISGLPLAGSVACDSVRNAAGVVQEGRWCADLPDTGFFFPGDVLHYYFEAIDDLDGDRQAATLPADTSGFSYFPQYKLMGTYDPRFTVRALPSDDAKYLVWFDSNEYEAWTLWQRAALRVFACGGPTDFYVTRSASSNLGNGLGARATVPLLSGYEGILYTAGALSYEVLGDSDPTSGEASPDQALLAAWLDLGYKGLMACGDNLATSVATSSGGTAFLADRFGTQAFAEDIRPYISAQTSPLVLEDPAGSFSLFADGWRADGGCPSIRTFDGVETTGSGVRVAQFTDPAGNPGAYPYAAAVGTRAVNGSSTLLFPYAMARVAADPQFSNDSDLEQAAKLIEGSLVALDLYPSFTDCWGATPDAPPIDGFRTEAYPNPFNPRVRIDYSIARPGRLRVKVFDLRGRLVRVLFDGQVAAAGHVDWDGTDAAGARVASGVYFYEARLGDESQVGRVMMIK